MSVPLKVFLNSSHFSVKNWHWSYKSIWMHLQHFIRFGFLLELLLLTIFIQIAKRYSPLQSSLTFIHTNLWNGSGPLNSTRSFVWLRTISSRSVYLLVLQFTYRTMHYTFNDEWPVLHSTKWLAFRKFEHFFVCICAQRFFPSSAPFCFFFSMLLFGFVCVCCDDCLL